MVGVKEKLLTLGRAGKTEELSKLVQNQVYCLYRPIILWKKNSIVWFGWIGKPISIYLAWIS